MIEGTFDAVFGFLANPPRLLQPDMLARIVLQVMLFSASAFFSGSETALFSLSKFDLQRLARARHPMAETLHRLLEQPRRLIVSILCGNELVNIAAAANMTAILVELLGVEAAAWTATFVMIPLILLLGEVTPKTLAVSNPVWAGTKIVAAPISTWLRIVAPLAFVVRFVADRTTTLLIGPERKDENILRIEELRTLIQQGVEAGEISPTERLLVHSLISAGSCSVREIMTPRAAMVSIDGRLDGAQQRERFVAARHARVPVFDGYPDHIIGFLHVEDLLAPAAGGEAGREALPLLHPVVAVPPTKEVDEMLDFFDEHGARAALVVNEFGSIDGIVTLSDVTRFLFAGVFDEEALELARIAPVDGSYEIDGSTPVSAVRRVTGIDVPDPLMTTIAGVAMRHFGRLPAVGDWVELDGFVLEVLAVEKLRIARVRLQPTGKPG